MRFHKCLFFLILFVGLMLTVSAQERFSGDRAYENIKTLCKPEFEGRKTGLVSARAAAEWIASQFKEWGLEPGGDDGSYIQEFPMLVTRQMKPSHLELENGLFGPVPYQEGNDYAVYFNSGSGLVEAEVVFAGFGISEPEKGWDDYAGIDVQGKIVLIYRGLPEGKEDILEGNDRDYRIRTAAEKGAAGLLMMRREFPVLGGTIRQGGYQSRLMSAAVSRKLARDIFQGTMKNMDHTLEDLKKSTQSFATGKTMKMDVAFDNIDPGQGENVIGIVRGRDPVLRDEYIVVGGHMDHNGPVPGGHVYVGADDNASGTAVVMELARILANREQKLRRSVVFAGFGGEEQGLLGSTHFADHPTIPGDRIAMMFNFDMEGQGDGGGSVGGRNYFSEIFHDVLNALPDSVDKKLRVGRGWGFGGSDHAPFIQQGIPALGFHSTGRHPFYHRVEDNIETINVASLQFVGDRAYELLVDLGDYPSSLLYEGHARGRCFTLFGDQIDYSMKTCTKDCSEDCLEKHVNAAVGMGVRVAVMDIQSWDESDEPDLFGAVDAFDGWIGQHCDHVMRYEDSGSLNRAAGSGILAAALGMSGTTLLGGKEGRLRQLARLGLDVIRLDDSHDPVFDGSALSAWGKSVLGVCEKENILLVLGLTDPGVTMSVIEAYNGKAVVQAPVKDILKNQDAYRRVVDDKNALLTVQCCPETEADQLSQIMDTLGTRSIHFSLFSPCLEHQEKESHKAVSAERFFRLIQNLYEKRMSSRDKGTVYDEMVRVLGGNLRRVLGESG